MVRLVDDADIDEWFNLEKEQLAERMQQALIKGASFEMVRAQFDKGLQALLEEYNKKYVDAASYKERHKRMKVPFKRFRAWRAGKRQQLALWWKMKKERFKQWRFERRYRKLFPEKKARK